MSTNQRRIILVAPACFKGSLSALEVAELMSDFLQSKLPGDVLVETCPIADGGDDTLAVLAASDAGFRFQQVQVMGPVPEMTVQAQYLVHTGKKQVIIEAAQAHGLKLLPQGQLDPMRATSYGVGELIRHAMQHEHPDDIIVSVGGSASTDGGLGMLQALGVQLFNAAGNVIQQPIGGQVLSKIQRIEWPTSWAYPGHILIATDVVNPLLGPTGAAAVFAPQKGATPQQCQVLEAGLKHVCQLLTKTCGMDYSDLQGVGAAGGLAYGLHHLPRVHIISGSQWVAEQLGLMAKIEQANLIITGEGRFDATSLNGKATGQVLAWAGNKPVFMVCGQVQENLNHRSQVAVCPLVRPGESPDKAMAHPKAVLLQRLEEMLPVLMDTLALQSH